MSAGAIEAPSHTSTHGCRSQAQRHGHRHVRGFSRGRGDAVVEIEVAVEVGETHAPERIARARERAGELRTTAARQERLLVAFDRRRSPRCGSSRSWRSTSGAATIPDSGSRRSPRIRTSRSSRSRASIAAGMPRARSAAGASSVPPDRPTESVGTPMNVLVVIVSTLPRLIAPRALGAGAITLRIVERLELHGGRHQPIPRPARTNRRHRARRAPRRGPPIHRRAWERRPPT